LSWHPFISLLRYLGEIDGVDNEVLSQCLDDYLATCEVDFTHPSFINILIDFYGFRGMPRKAVEAFNTLEQRGGLPVDATYDDPETKATVPAIENVHCSIIEAFCRNREYPSAEAWFQKCKKPLTKTLMVLINWAPDSYKKDLYIEMYNKLFGVEKENRLDYIKYQRGSFEEVNQR